MRATTDRGTIIHLAGRARLSPAVRDGVPAFAGPGDLAGRCGWAPFFEALEGRDLAVAWDDDEAPDLRFVARETAAPPPRRGRALEEARRFLRALRGRAPRGR
jgi:hypothetical protein